ncbi:MAG: sugar phosphate isomerase/epimerase family protein, partial [Gemmatimonadota bacterium]
FAGYFNHPPARVAAMLSASNLTSPSAHVDIGELRRGADAVFERAEEIGHHFVTIPWIPAAERTVEGYTRIAGDLDRWGEMAARRGMTIAYHNHDFEFRDLDGSSRRNGMNLLIELSDPALVRFQLDVFWITRAGLDASDWIRRYPGRFVMLHVKDMKADGTMTEAGQGRIDFARIIRESNGSLQHLLVEHDQPSDPFASIAVSAAYMKRL